MQADVDVAEQPRAACCRGPRTNATYETDVFTASTTRSRRAWCAKLLRPTSEPRPRAGPRAAARAARPGARARVHSARPRRPPHRRRPRPPRGSDARPRRPRKPASRDRAIPLATTTADAAPAPGATARRRAAPRPAVRGPARGRHGGAVAGDVHGWCSTRRSPTCRSPRSPATSRVSPSQGTWVITSFAVANAISVPLTGWLTQRFGQVRLFTLATLLFVAAIVAVRTGHQHRHADRVPRAAGPGRRADDPAVAGAAAGELSAAQGAASRCRCGR